MNLSRFRYNLAIVFIAAVCWAQKEYKPKEEKLPGPAIQQPIAYSHKTHVGLGLQCTGCHTMTGEGFQATYPKETFCMGCHSTIKKESAEIQKLAAFAAKKQAVPWIRIYQVPDMVWFSHTSHVKQAKIECAHCHGEVAQRDVLFKEKSTSMNTCMDCHARSKAPNGCDFCHASQ
jgi:hypothetical protein